MNSRTSSAPGACPAARTAGPASADRSWSHTTTSSGHRTEDARRPGLACPVPYDLDAIRAADLVIIPNWRDPAEPPPAPLLEALRAAHANGGRVAGLCSGAFLLAAAGLLDDRPATTHWALAGLMAQMYPKVQVQAGLLFIDDGDVLTAGGGAAGMDLGLHLLRAHCGAEVASRLARYMVVPPHRSGGQAQYIESPGLELDEANPVGETLAWALGRLDQALPVQTLARRAQMSRRTFDRRYPRSWPTTSATSTPRSPKDRARGPGPARGPTYPGDRPASHPPDTGARYPPPRPARPAAAPAPCPRSRSAWWPAPSRR